MTTIIGVKTTKGPIDAVVMGADAAFCYSQDDNEEYKRFTHGTKFIYQEGSKWMMLHSGTLDDAYYEFRKRVLETPTRVQETYDELSDLVAQTTTKRHPQFAPAVQLREAEKDLSTSERSALLLGICAGKDGKPGLWKFGSEGQLVPYKIDTKHPFPYLCAGAGDTNVTSIFSELVPKGFHISIYDAVDFVKSGLKIVQDRKRRDGSYEKGTYCKGYQIAIVTRDKIWKTKPFRQKQKAEFEDCCAETLWQVMSINLSPSTKLRRRIERVHLRDFPGIIKATDI